MKIETIVQMPKWILKRLLQIRISTYVAFILCFIALVRLGYFGIYNYEHIPQEAIENELYKAVTPHLVIKKTKPNCTYNEILQSKETLQNWQVPTKFAEFTAAGISNGSFAPEHCNPLFSVAILVTYRNRQSQLDIFLPYMHNFLRKQNIHYKIFLIEQQDNKYWNKGLLYNIGARVAMAEKFPCLILHDVDMLPLDTANLYVCLHQPRHMSGSLDKFRFVLPYSFLVGGALAIRADHYKLVNGFSNRFEKWGGEDDDFSARLEANNLKITRLPKEMSRYTMLPHAPQEKNEERTRIMAENQQRGAGADGLHSARYDALRVTRQRLVTQLAVRL